MFRAFAAVALVAVAAGASAQSLGDAAAREQRRREDVRRKASPARVVTGDDLTTNTGRIANDSAGTPAPVPSAAPAPPAAPAPSADPVEATRAADQQREAHWRQEARERRERVTHAEDAVKRTSRWSDPTYAGNDRPSCPITMRNEQARARGELANARRSLDALQDEARVGGALPGWIR